MASHVVLDEGGEAPDQPIDERLLGGEVIKESALRHAGRARGGVEGGRAFAVVHEDLLERVEHGVACGWGAAHVLDRSERHPSMT